MLAPADQKKRDKHLTPIIKLNNLTRVGVGDLVDLIRIEPNLSLTTLEDGGSETLLDKKGYPIHRIDVNF